MKTFSKILIIASISSLLVACGQKEGDSSTTSADSVTAVKVKPVKVESITKQEIAITQTYPATISAGKEAHLAPSQPGQIKKIYVQVGDKVKAGQLLVEMDATAYNQIRMQYLDAKRDLQRMDTLIKYGSISQQVYDKTKLQYEVLYANMKTMEENAFVRAPFSGVITGKYFNDRETYTGMVASLGISAIVTLMQMDELKVVVNISERFFPQVKEGMTAKLESDIYPGKTYTGTIKSIYPTIDANTKTFKVEIAFTNPTKELRPGMFSRVIIDFGKTMAMVVPAQAVMKQEGTNDRYVFINNSGKAKRVLVEIGERYNDKIEIISKEISEGTQLIVSGQVNLIDGAPIEVK